MDEYAEQAVALVRNPSRRLAEGRSLAESIAAHHCGKEWTDQLLGIRDSIPTTHNVNELRSVDHLFPAALEFWAAFSRLEKENPILHVAMRALTKSMGIVPQMDLELSNAVQARFPRARQFGLELRFRRWRFQLGKCRRQYLRF
jgi:hypothetical protein